MGNNPLVRLKALARWQKAALTTVVLLLLYTLAGFFVLPAVVRMVAVNQLRQRLHRDVQIEAVRLNPFTLSATVRNAAVFAPDSKDRLAAFRELYVNLQSVSLFRWAPVVKELRLDGLYGSVVLYKDHRWNFSDLLPAPPDTGTTAPSEEEAEEKPFRFSFNNIQLTGGEIHFRDDIRGKTHDITGIDMALPFLSNLPAQINIFVDPHFYADINGTPFNLQGKVKPFAGSRETELNLDLRNIDLAAYMPYVPPDADVRIHSGRLDMKLAVTYEAYEDGSHALRTAGLVALRSLDLTDGADRPLLKLDQLRVDIGDLEPMAGLVRIQEILLQGAVFTITRLPTERIVRTSEALPLREVFHNINLPPPVVKIAATTLEDARLQIRDLMSPSAEGKDTEPDGHTMVAIPRFNMERVAVNIDNQVVNIEAVDTAEGVFELRRMADGALNLGILLPPKQEVEPPAAPETKPWQVDMQRLHLAGYSVKGVNLVPEDPVSVTVDAIDLAVKDFSTLPGAQTALDLSCRINQTGRLESHTTLTLQPLGAKTQLSLEKLDLAAFYPFMKPYIGVVLADGDLSLGGEATLKTGEEGAPSLNYRGNAAIHEFRTLDHRSAQPFITWQVLDMGGMDIGVNPTYVNIDDISVAKPFSRMLIDEQGRLNLAVAAEPGAGDRPASPVARKDSGSSSSAQPVPITIRAIKSDEGTLVFADRSFKPGFQATIEAVKSTIIGISSEGTQPALVEIEGRVEGHAPVSITGRIQPLKDHMYADLAFDFKQVDLTAASPYSGRYVGRTISRGKLSVKTTYHIENDTFKADHDILIDQFNFGRKVQSPDDLGLPVDLAVALLKDRRGQIHINLPVSGHMDDPEISIGGIVLQALANLIVKAATSPFDLLGSMFGGEDIDHLAFQPGSTGLTPETTAKLDALTKILYERPALQLEISGYADPQGDTPAAAEILFQNKLRAQKALQLADQGQSNLPLADIAIAPEEFEDLLQKAYKAENFKKPTNFFGFEKTLPPQEAEALIRQHIEVGTAELEELAYARALAVKDYLLDSGKVDPARVFLVKPANTLAPEVAEGVSAACVMLGLK